MAAAVIKLGCPPAKIRVHHLGVDVDGIAFRPRIWDGVSPLRVLVAASFQEKKGIPYGLHALGLLRRKVPIEVTIIGDASPQRRSRQERTRIMDEIRRNDLAGATRLLGYVPYARLFEEAYRHHIFLAPSVSAHDGDTEGGAPVTIIEMAATGMPVVSTLHGDIPEVVENGRSGLLAPERDVMAVFQHLQWLVQHPDEWDQITRAARARVEAEFNARVQGERLARLYQEILT
jgi:colanic acid/amylovoran biosynthesis glycosyltransferase